MARLLTRQTTLAAKIESVYGSPEPIPSLPVARRARRRPRRPRRSPPWFLLGTIFGLLLGAAGAWAYLISRLSGISP